LKRITDRGRLGRFHRLHMMEMANPTGFIDAVIEKIRQPHREHTFNVLRELLGPSASQEELELCELSVIGQCLTARHGRGLRGLGPGVPLSEKEVEELADHITSFSIAGIEAMRARLATTCKNDQPEASQEG
jgi:hypothetical protein